MVRPGEMASPRHGKGALRARVKNLKNDHIWGGRVRPLQRGKGARPTYPLPYLAGGATRGSETDRTRSSNTPISPNDQLSARPGAFAAHF